MKTILAYIAGYIDGDGCFFIGKNHHPVKYRSGIIVNSIDKNIIRFFKNEFGGSITFGKQKPKFKRYNLINSWQFQGENAIRFAHNVIPFLKEKKNDALLFIEFCKEKSKDIKDSYIEMVKSNRLNNNLVTIEEIKRLNLIQKKGLPSEEDLSYLAGFIDAECNFTISRYKPKNRPNPVYKIILQCNNTKTPTISWLLQTFGGICYFVPRKHKNPKHKDQIAWRITGKSLSLILPKLIPFLKYKKPVCQLLIEFYATTLVNGGDRQKKEFRSSYQSTLVLRDTIVDKVHLLNSKTVKAV